MYDRVDKNADFKEMMLNRKHAIPTDDFLSMTNDIIANVRRISETINHVRDFTLSVYVQCFVRIDGRF